MSRILLAFVALFLAVAPASLAADTPIRVYSAGSLRAAWSDLAKAFTAAYGDKVETTFGGSGLLKDKLLSGEPADLFTSADTGNPLALTEAGKAGPTVLFARNRLCAIGRPGLKLATKTVLATMLDPKIKLGTSTPKADPAGDYAWELFRKADAVKQGSRAILEAKAIKIGNVPGSLAAPPNVGNATAWLFREGKADMFVAYCTGVPELAAELRGVTGVELPPELAVAAGYGLTVLNSGDRGRAAQLALFILSPAGQKILADHGFGALSQP